MKDMLKADKSLKKRLRLKGTRNQSSGLSGRFISQAACRNPSHSPIVLSPLPLGERPRGEGLAGESRKHRVSPGPAVASIVGAVLTVNEGPVLDRADQFFTVGGDSSRRLPENGRKSATGVASYSPILTYFEELIRPGDG